MIPHARPPPLGLASCGLTCPRKPEVVAEKALLAFRGQDTRSRTYRSLPCPTDPSPRHESGAVAAARLPPAVFCAFRFGLLPARTGARQLL